MNVVKLIYEYVNLSPADSEGHLEKCLIISDSQGGILSEFGTYSKDMIHVHNIDEIAREICAQWLPSDVDHVIINLGENIDVWLLDEQLLSVISRALRELVNAMVQTGRELHCTVVYSAQNLVMPLLTGLLQSVCLEVQRLSFSEVKLISDASAPPSIIKACRNRALQYAQYDGKVLSTQKQMALTKPTLPQIPLSLSEQHSIVVLGGAGGVGLQLCQYLHSRFGCRIAVIGRSAPDEQRRQKLKRAGIELYLRGDVANFEQLRDGMKQITGRFGKIDFVFNLAGVLDDCLFSNLTDQAYRNVLTPKVMSIVNLMRLNSVLTQSVIVNFSSYTSVVGNVGQSAYGSANYFKDSVSRQFSHWRSINWGLWESDGMQMDSEEMLAMPANSACDIMLRLLTEPPYPVAVFKRNTSQKSLTSSHPSTKMADTNAVQLTRLEVEQWLKGVVTKVGKLKTLQEDSSFLDLGLDSVALINIALSIEKKLREASSDISFNKSLLFEYPSISALSGYLIERYFAQLVKCFVTTQIDNDAPSHTSENQQASSPSSHEFKGFQDWLLSIVKRVSGLRQLSSDDNLLDKGVDSVLSIRISAEISRSLQEQDPQAKAVSKTIIFEYASVAKLADYFSNAYESVVSSLTPKTSQNIPQEMQQHAPVKQVQTSTKKSDMSHLSISNSQSTSRAQPSHAQQSSAQQEYRDDDIAIIGLSGEFPGADSPAEFWELLRNGENAISEIPSERWDWRQDFNPDAALPQRSRTANGSYSRHGGFVSDVGGFDYRFFNITPLEAERLDPQERRFLQVAYQALEDAGYFLNPHKNVGVYVASMFGHYQDLMAEKGPLSSSFSSIANRVSFSCDLKGPSLAVDSMCSGGLSALHLACNSIKLNDCQWAIVGGVNLMTHPGKYRVLSAGKFSSPTGQCHSFGIAADGYVPGEGVIAYVITSVAEARKLEQKGVVPYAVIRGTALNSGGKVSAYTVPSPQAQAEVIQKALDNADIDKNAISYVEAHGTGTSLGDPIEVQALSRVLAGDEGKTCYLGSVKTNVGHLESAAALAGLTKIIGQLHHKELMPTLHASIENPWLELSSTPFKLVKSTKAWSAGSEHKLTAALSSFGAGGANGHAIIQEYTSQSRDSYSEVGPYVILLSGDSRDAVRRQTQALLKYLTTFPDTHLHALSYTLSCARPHMNHRDYVIAENVPSLVAHLTSLIAQDDALVGDAKQLERTSIDWQKLTKAFLAGENVDFQSCFKHKPAICRQLYYAFDNPFIWAESMLPQVIFANSDRNLEATNKATDIVPSAELMSATWQKVLEPVHNNASLNDEQHLPLVMAQGAYADTLSGACHQVFSCSSIMLSKQNIRQRLESLLSDNAQATFYLYFSADGWSPYEVLWLLQVLQKAQQSICIAFLCGETDTPEQLAIFGMFRGLAQENPHIRAQRFMCVNAEKQAALEDWQVEKLVTFAKLQLNQIADSQSWKLDFSGNTGTTSGTPISFQLRQSSVVLSNQESRLKTGGVYLITGGFGMVGQAIARALSDRYQAKLVLVGRSRLDAKKQKILNSLGENAHYMQADITDVIQCHSLVANIVHSLGPISGVVQSAGVLRDALVQNKTVEDIRAVWDVKVTGTKNLDLATASQPLDFFCMYSSMASQLGNIGQCDYIAANQFLDEFSERRAKWVQSGKRTGHTLSINWPLWIDEQEQQAGYNDKYASLATFFKQEFGIEALTQSVGSELFMSWVNGIPNNLHQVMGFVGDNNKIRATILDDDSLSVDHITQLTETNEAGFSEADSYEEGAQTHRRALTHEEMTEILIESIAELTKLKPSDIRVDLSWGDLGLDSVMLQTFAQSLLQQVNVNVPPTALFSYGSINALSGYLLKQNASIANEEAAPAPIAQEQKITGNPDNDVLDRQAILSSGAPGAPVAEMQSELNSTFNDIPDSSKRFAIIGMAGQMPGAKSLSDFWRLLINNQSAIRKVERWPDKTYYAGLIEGIDQFDAKFFGLSAREAMLMDPQHRLFLQTSYNAILDAGYTPEQCDNVGVFAGVQFNDYQTLIQMKGNNNHPYAATGNAHAMLANRVSYLLNFSGPSQTIDTACSSALVALNRGVASLVQNECDVALVGAVSLLIDPAMSDAAASMGVLSKDSRCATFDNDANGYVRAEGVGCFVVKRLNKAMTDGDSIYAVIENVFENHGGKANSLTSPNPNAQTALLKKTYSKELADRVSYIETHGTGTELGDPIEIEALKQAFNEMAPQKDLGSIALGAVKTNVGHLEPAAAVASLFKVIMALKHKQLPANINFNRLNPHIALQDTPMRLLTRNEAWQSDTPRVAGISSFGFGGSNAHAVISEYVEQTQEALNADDALGSSNLILLSARSRHSLQLMAEQLRVVLLQNETSLQYNNQDSLSLHNIAYTLAAGRGHFEYRLAFVVSSTQELCNKLSQQKFDDIPPVKPSISVEEISRVSQAEAFDAFYLEDLASQYLRGSRFAWDSWYRAMDKPVRRVHLPGYAFDTKPYWFEQALDNK